MGFKIIWSQFDEYQIDIIFNYYANNIDVKIARSITFQIRDKVSELYSNPYIGQKEEFLSDRPEDYRYCLVKNYKIIYSVNEDLQIIKITDVFDTRQNPIKLKRN